MAGIETTINNPFRPIGSSYSGCSLLFMMETTAIGMLQKGWLFV